MRKIKRQKPKEKGEERERSREKDQKRKIKRKRSREKDHEGKIKRKRSKEKDQEILKKKKRNREIVKSCCLAARFQVKLRMKSACFAWSRINPNGDPNPALFNTKRIKKGIPSPVSLHQERQRKTPTPQSQP